MTHNGANPNQAMAFCNDCGSLRMVVPAIMVAKPKLAIVSSQPPAMKPCPVCANAKGLRLLAFLLDEIKGHVMELEPKTGPLTPWRTEAEAMEVAG